jgi:hypothetical protein
MKKLYYVILFMFLTGCATVPMEDEKKDINAKQFHDPIDGKSGVYIYRKFGPGTALTKKIMINDECIGKSAPSVYFYKQVEANKQYVISTQSEFSPNTLELYTESGKNYFIENYIKVGLFIGGADLKERDEQRAKKDIAKLKLASNSGC